MTLPFQANFACGFASARYARLRSTTRLSHTEFTETTLHQPALIQLSSSIIDFTSMPSTDIQSKTLPSEPKSHRIKAMEKAEIKKNGRVSWSQDEVKLLKRLFPRGRAREIAEQTGRPLTAVKQKAYSLGIHTKEWRPWSAYEVELLKELYPNENVVRIADRLGRSLKSVSSKVSKIGLRKVRNYPPWSSQEITLLKKLYPDNNLQDIANQVGRNVSAVRTKLHKLGVSEKRRVWSKRELNLLKKLYPSRTAQQIADQIGRSVQATRRRIAKLGLRKRKWLD